MAGPRQRACWTRPWPGPETLAPALTCSQVGLGSAALLGSPDQREGVHRTHLPPRAAHRLGDGAGSFQPYPRAPPGRGPERGSHRARHSDGLGPPGRCSRTGVGSGGKAEGGWASRAREGSPGWAVSSLRPPHRGPGLTCLLRCSRPAQCHQPEVSLPVGHGALPGRVLAEAEQSRRELPSLCTPNLRHFAAASDFNR